MPIPTIIKKLANDVRTKIYGVDVRESIAKSMEETGRVSDETNTRSKNTESRQNHIEARYDVAIGGRTEDSEILDARVGRDGEATFTNLKNRLDTEFEYHTEKFLDININVKTFGAVGDFVKDDTQSIVNALEFAKNNNIKKVYLPSGTHKVDPNTIVVPENVTLIGSTLRDSIIRGANKTGVGVKLLQGATAKDLYVRGYEIGIENTSHFTKIVNTKLSYNVVGVTFNTNSYIVSCLGNEITFNDVGVMIGGLTYELVIKDNIIDNNKIGVIGHSSSHGFILNDNTIEGNSNRDTGVGCGLLLCGLNYSRTNIYGNWFESNGVASNKSVDVITSPYSPGSNNDPYALGIYNDIIDNCVPPKFHDLVRNKTITVGNLNFVGNVHTITKHAFVLGFTEKLKFKIADSSFSGLKGQFKIPIYIGSKRDANVSIKIENNNTFHSGDISIDEELNQGVNGTYVYSDGIIPTTTNKITVDGEDLFLPKVEFKDLLEKYTYYEIRPNIISGNGDIVDGGYLDNKYVGKMVIGDVFSSELTRKNSNQPLLENKYSHYIMIGNKYSKYRIQFPSSYREYEIKEHDEFDIMTMRRSGELPSTNQVFGSFDNNIIYLIVFLTQEEYNRDFKGIEKIKVEGLKTDRIR